MTREQWWALPEEERERRRELMRQWRSRNPSKANSKRTHEQDIRHRKVDQARQERYAWLQIGRRTNANVLNEYGSLYIANHRQLELEEYVLEYRGCRLWDHKTDSAGTEFLANSKPDGG